VSEDGIDAAETSNVKSQLQDFVNSFRPASAVFEGIVRPCQPIATFRRPVCQDGSDRDKLYQLSPRSLWRNPS
jgi:hypothetical protein